MSDLVTLDEAKAFLNVHPTAASEDEKAIEDVIRRASRICHTRLGRQDLTYRAYEAVRMSGPLACRLWLNGPIDVDVPITLTLDGSTLTVWQREADGDPADFDATVRSSSPGHEWCPDQLHRNTGWQGSGVRDEPIVISYTGGFREIPDDIREACLLICQKLYRDQSRALADVATINAPSGSMSLYDAFIPRRASEALGMHRRVGV